MDEEQFMRLFEDAPQVQLFSARELEDHLNQIRETIADQTKDWSKRVDAVSFLTLFPYPLPYPPFPVPLFLIIS